MANRYLISAQFAISQDGNTLGTTGETEILAVRCEYQLPGEEPFLVIGTEGFSFDDIEDLAKIIKAVQDAEKLCRSSLEQ
jgi:hypothetical protein